MAMYDWAVAGNVLARTGFLREPGAYVLVDGQFGSTGKGLAAAFIAMSEPVPEADCVLTNAGPNSGHTSYYNGEKIVLKQLPTYSVVMKKMGVDVYTEMDAGAIVDLETLGEELKQHDLWDFAIHPRAAIVTEEALSNEKDMHERIGSTGKGTGAALANKVMRDPNATASGNEAKVRTHANVGTAERSTGDTYFLEVSQGFSLGINQRFYPYCTSRECTVGQAMSDAGLHPSQFRQAMMVVRTFPIRVAGNSGACYHDQKEIKWSDLGVEPEYTTVTNKVRRVFTWSDQQYRDALHANRPSTVFVNFMNYLDRGIWDDWLMKSILDPYIDVMGTTPDAIFLGTSPYVEDVKLWM